MAKIKICLDAGHYGKYNQSPAIPEYYESEMVWKLHLLLKKYLEQYGFEVTQTRSDQEKDMGLTARGKASKGCDLFLSLHSNAVGSGMNESVDYPVVYVPLNGSGTEIGKKLADCIASTMGTKQKGEAKSRKGSGDWDYYSVIYGAVSVGVPGLILEHSFHTNTRATKWLLDDSNLDKLAKAEAAVIAAHYGVEAPVTGDSSGGEITPGKSDPVMYRVQVGAYSVKKNADAQLAKVKAAGFDTYMVKSDGYFKIQVGAYSVKANAEKQLSKVKAAGFDAFITTKGGEAVTDDSGYTQTDFIKDVQRACGAAVDGVAGDETISKTPTLSAKENACHAAVKAVQKRLKALGYDEVGTADGVAGAKFTSAVAHFQQDNGCVVDGIITAKNKTWRKLLGME